MRFLDEQQAIRFLFCTVSKQVVKNGLNSLVRCRHLSSPSFLNPSLPSHTSLNLEVPCSPLHRDSYRSMNGVVGIGRFHCLSSISNQDAATAWRCGAHQ